MIDKNGNVKQAKYAKCILAGEQKEYMSSELAYTFSMHDRVSWANFDSVY